MVRIDRVEACTVSVPLSAPISFATRTVRSRQYTLVRVFCDDGSSGLGFCYVSNEGGALATAAVRTLFAPKILGGDPWCVERHWERLYQDTLLHGRAGSVLRALSAVDIALWDRNARAAGVPLWKFLGGAREDSVGAYASGGYYLEGKGVRGLAEEVAAYVKNGFSTVKIKVGGAPLREDVDRVAAAREALGPEGVLLLDATHAWTSLHGARRAAEAFAPFDPLFLEEPFGPDDTVLHRQLVEMSGTPIAAGELLGPRWDFHRLLTSHALHFAQPDATGCGGITEFLRIAGTCASFGVEVWPHWFHDLHVHLVGGLSNSGMVEFFPDAAVLNFRELITNQLHVEGGRIRLPEAPGLGFDFEGDQVSRYALDRWA